MFGATVKSLRLEKRLTLIAFCEGAGLDLVHWSKVERGVAPPPGEITTLQRLADFCGLRGERRLALLDEAAVDRRGVAKSVPMQQVLPAFLPTPLDVVTAGNLARDIRALHG